MITSLEHGAAGAVLLAAAGIGLARGAVYFRRTQGNADRFFATSSVSIALVALLVGGLFCLVNAVTAAEDAWRLPAALASVAAAVLLPAGIWRSFGPHAAARTPRPAR